MNTHLTHDDAVLHFYGDTGSEAAAIDAHLASCPACRDAFARLRDTLAAVEALPPEDPPPGFEARLWARIAPELHVSWWRRVRSWQTALVPAVAAASLGLVAFGAGWWARPVAPQDSAAAGGAAVAVQGATPAARAIEARERVLAAAVGDHLDRSGIVLTELLNGPLPDAEGLAVERVVASDLVATSRLYRQSAGDAGDDTLVRTLDDLERVLLEIANAPADLSASDLAAWRARIERRDLLFRVRVLADGLRAANTTPPAASAPARKGPQS